jgi:hypothetical protein
MTQKTCVGEGILLFETQELVGAIFGFPQTVARVIPSERREQGEILAVRERNDAWRIQVWADDSRKGASRRCRRRREGHRTWAGREG